MTNRDLSRVIGATFDQFSATDPLPIEVIFFIALHHLGVSECDKDAAKIAVLDYLQNADQFSVVVIRHNQSGEYRINPLKQREPLEEITAV